MFCRVVMLLRENKVYRTERT